MKASAAPWQLMTSLPGLAGSQVPCSGDAGMENAPADLESEMLKRGMLFEVIDWDEGQGKLPLED